MHRQYPGSNFPNSRFLALGQNNPRTIARFMNEFEILSKARSPHFLNVIELKTLPNGSFIVFENFSTTSLPVFLSKRSFKLEEVLKLSIGACEAVIDVHKQNLIHKNISPDNFLIDPSTMKLKLTAFDSAVTLSRENQEVLATNGLEVNLKYISPEQTGRMNRPLDYRSDIYSLGATIYFLLTGQAPFETTDPLELVYAHVAKGADAAHVHRQGLPVVLSRMLCKTLEKSVEDRYQSAVGLKLDLERCLSGLQQSGCVEDFEIALRDIPQRFELSQRIYGRDAELGALLGSYFRVAQRGSEVVLVEGLSGTGKSALVSEVRKPLLKNNGHFLSGKFDQFNRGVPYSAFIQAFSGFVGKILLLSDSEISEIRQQLFVEIGPAVRCLIDVVPMIEQITGPCPEISTAGPQDKQRKLHHAFIRLIQLFASEDRPFVLFLDDLQWADLQSIQLLGELIVPGAISHFLCINAYRDNEVHRGHPYVTMLDNRISEGVMARRLQISALTVENIRDLLCDTLRTQDPRVSEFARIIHKKTAGNAFFVAQLVKKLYLDGVISFENGAWTWDIDRLGLTSVSENVVDLMVGRISKLKDESKEMLMLAACIGNKFDLELLSTVCEKTPFEVARLLWPSLEEAYVIPLDTSYSLMQSFEHKKEGSEWAMLEEELARILLVSRSNLNFKFQHDKIQQASASLIPSDSLPAWHLKIGRLLLKGIRDEKLDEELFEIANHVNKGIGLVTDASERYTYAKLNISAGQKAKSANAQRIAIEYFESALTFLGHDCWSLDHEMTFKIYSNLVECSYLDSDFVRSRGYANTGITHSREGHEYSELAGHLLQVSITEGQDFGESVRLAEEIMRHYGVEMPGPENDLEQMVHKLESKLLKLRGKRSIADLFDVPKNNDVSKIQFMNHMVQVWVAGYFSQNAALLQLSTYHLVLTSLEYGMSEASSFGFISLGFFKRFGGKLSEGYEYGQLAMRLALEKFESLAYVLRVGNIFAHCINPYVNHYRTNIPIYLRSYEVAPETGDLIYGVWSAYFLLMTRFISGESLTSVAAQEQRVIDFIRKINDQNILLSANYITQAVASLQGKTRSVGELNCDGFEEASCLATFEKAKFIPGLGWAGVIGTMVRFIGVRPAREVYEAARLVENILPYDDGFFPINTHYVYQSLAICRLISDSDEAYDHSVLRQQLSRNVQKLAELAQGCPDNFHHRHKLVQAEIARIEENHQIAFQHYDESIRFACANDFIHEEALARELAGRCYLSFGNHRVGQNFIRTAATAYEAWGALGKVRSLKEEFDFIEQSQALKDQGQQNLDLTSITQILDLLSREVNEEALLDKSMEIILKHSGASRGVLALSCGENFTIVGEGTNSGFSKLQEPLEQSRRVSQRVLNSVLRSNEAFVSDNVLTDLRLEQDDYLNSFRPLSILCLPVKTNRSMPGLLYLENDRIAQLFTHEKVRILELITNSLATGLENAVLYKEMEERVAHRTNELQMAQSQLTHSKHLSTLGEMASGIAHEINNPLAILTTTCKFMKKSIAKGSDPESLVEYIDDMLKTVERLSKITIGMRNIARNSNDEDFQLTRVGAILDDVFSIARERFRNKSMGLEVIDEFNLQESEIYCRQVQISQVLMNLLNNAHDALEASGLEEKWVKIHLRLDGADFLFVIEDAGLGIPEAVQDKIFQPLFTTKEVGKGTGIGLSLSKNLIENHHGKLILDKTAKHTTFVVRIPIRTAAAA